MDNQHLFATSLMAATLGKHLKMKKMKKFLKTLALVAVAAVGAVSCTDTIADDTITPSTTGGVTLYATTPSDDASTRIAFEDNDSEGITLSWEEGDTFNLYKEGETELVATFTCADAATGLFTSTVESLEETTYTAKYNETVDIYNQNGDEINNLDAACQMEATFVYTADSSISITFEHTMAIMTFKFESAERPAKLVFENGEETYTVTYSSIEPDNNIYTSHIMIEPCGDGETSRTMTFSLYDSDGTAYDIRSVETTKVYEAGMRYTASVSDLANTVVSGLWTDFAAESFSGGVVYSDDITAYTISTPEQFAYLATLVNEGETMSGVTFTLNNDINLSGHEWVAIGPSYSIPFNGVFDGNNFAVSNLYINQSSTNYQGLFGHISYYEDTDSGEVVSAIVKNLGVTSGEVTGKQYVGGIMGRSTISSVINCYNKASVIGTYSGSAYVGGVVGNSGNSSITKCYNSGTVTAEKGGYVGGVVGNSYYSSGNTTLNSALSSVTDCYNTAEATVTGGNEYVGGVAGRNFHGTLVNSYNNAAVISNYSSTKAYVGGVTGYNYNASVVNCYNSGSVTAENGGYVGGVVGHNEASSTNYSAPVVNCYNRGVVAGSTATSYYAGGVVGYNYIASVVNCYNAAAVSGGCAGGVAGRNTYTITDCYYDNDEYDGVAVGSDSATTTITEALTTEEMQADDFVTELNENAVSYNDAAEADAIQACAWVAVVESYPTLDFDGVPSNQD